MKIKATLHVEGHPGDAHKEGTEGVILEFYVPRAQPSPRQIADLYRKMADGFRKQIEAFRDPNED